ncbi:hypothetical protein [uncultured Dysosmobacter sp.]|uniref:hypothetical protein n=1 Tax=uncultured Dysosmobacter sp. TaxID=2591384 RepID=UPI00263805E0|nr:hypothetical protein [uncultured Dysosmobacter sp.]
MKNNIHEIISKYTAGETTLEEANAALAGSGIHLDPEKNTLTEAEKRGTTVGCYPDQANGFGLLDSGTGTLDKVAVQDGCLTDCDMGESFALVHIAGRVYEVKGRELVDHA